MRSAVEPVQSLDALPTSVLVEHLLPALGNGAAAAALSSTCRKFRRLLGDSVRRLDIDVMQLTRSVATSGMHIRFPHVERVTLQVQCVGHMLYALPMFVFRTCRYWVSG